MTELPDVNSDWLSKRKRVRHSRGRVRTASIRPNRAIDLASNDYLGLAQDPRLLQAAHQALDNCGCGATASRVVTGTTWPHVELETALADFTGFQSCLVFSSGYLANLAALTALSGPDCAIYLDAHAHASLQDGSRLARGERHTFAHNNIEDLDRLLATRNKPRALVVVESIYSVLGDLAPLTDLYELCTRYDAWLIVDEAHGLGVRGNGAGLCTEMNLAGRSRILATATLSKALGSQGGAILAGRDVTSHLVNEGRSFIFDTGLAPAAAASAREALQVIQATPELVSDVHATASQIATALNISPTPGAVQSLPMPSADIAFQVAQECRQQGVLVGCFRPPAVPDGVSRLRFTARAAQPRHELTQGLSIVQKFLHKYGVDSA